MRTELQSASGRNQREGIVGGLAGVSEVGALMVAANTEKREACKRERAERERRRRIKRSCAR